MVCLLIGLSGPNCELKLLRSHLGWGLPKEPCIVGHRSSQGRRNFGEGQICGCSDMSASMMWPSVKCLC